MDGIRIEADLIARVTQIGCTLKLGKVVTLVYDQSLSSAVIWALSAEAFIIREADQT